ncbi:hypothetical protein HWD35_20880 [Tsukamurella tyrosinosolvens]|uniref:Gp19/Gp15/Gp42 family protein n=1 Tax=Tsukamurella tyrosinosolvens TaxID=57704 RepID=UPI001CE0C287|nr:Gp19/Gp15/Gp42 family protein [Tsukamurella tyrosinosolvens]MCA4997181.1 hypothetical protein [Tsukamurella tyrosinosolvens]
MAAFAEVTELEAQWRTLSTAERAAAASHLDGVAALIRAEFKDKLGLNDVPADRLDAAKQVSIDVVKTALATAFVAGHTQYGRAEGPRSKSGTLAAPGGTLALTDWHREQLGLPVNPAPAWHFPVGDY